MRSPKVIRAGTGNKNFFIWPYNIGNILANEIHVDIFKSAFQRIAANQ